MGVLVRFAGIVMLLAAVASSYAQEPPKRLNFAGEITGDAVWSGEVRLTGDVIVSKAATLRIRPGTRVIAKPLPMPRGASSAHDLRPELVEVHVFGAVDARGREGERIEFGSEPEQKQGRKEGDRPTLVPSWLGFVMHGERPSRSRFTHCVFRGAQGAIQCTDGSPEIEDSVFLACSIGVGAGTAWGDSRGRRRVAPRHPGPSVLRCRFGGCDTGVYLDSGGRPAVTRCVFLDCRIGVGRWAAGITSAPRGLGALVDRSDFIMNLVAVHGSGSVRNSIFYKNRLVFGASGFHRFYAALIDRYHRTHNVYFGNNSLTNDDIPLGEGAQFEDPGYRGPVEKSLALLLTRDLGTALGLTPKSPVRRTASDGGDPGSWGAVGAARSEGAFPPPEGGRPLGEWLAPGPPGSFEDEDLAAVKKALARSAPAPVPGRAIGHGLWCVLAAENGVLEVPRVLAVNGRDAVLLTGVVAEEKGTAILHLGMDGLLAEAFWNGSAMPVPEAARRFDPRDLPRTVKLEKGANTLLVRIRFRGEAPRLSAWLTAEGIPLAPLMEEGEVRQERMVKGIVLSTRKGRRPGRAVVNLTTAAHWMDAVNPRSFEILGPGDVNVAIPANGIEYKPRRKRILIQGLDLEAGTVYRFRVVRLRDVRGRPARTVPEVVEAKTR